jgi:HK97 gp10 family phage protein
MIEATFQWTESPFAKLDDMRASIKNRICRIALNKASAVVKAAVVANAPQHYGFLVKAIRIKVKSYSDKTVWLSVIGAKSDYVRSKGRAIRGKHKGEKRLFRPAKYLALVDQGTKHAKGKHFMSKAFLETKQDFQSVLLSSVEDQLAKVMAKTPK